MNLSSGCPVPKAQFASLSLLMRHSAKSREFDKPRGETILVASPISITTNAVCQASLDRLHDKLANDTSVGTLSPVSEFKGVGNIALYYTVVRDTRTIRLFTTCMFNLDDPSSSTYSAFVKGKQQPIQHQTKDGLGIEKHVAGVVLCVGMSGSVSASSATSTLVHELPNRISESVPYLASLIQASMDKAAATAFASLQAFGKQKKSKSKRNLQEQRSNPSLGSNDAEGKKWIKFVLSSLITDDDDDESDDESDVEITVGPISNVSMSAALEQSTASLCVQESEMNQVLALYEPDMVLSHPSTVNVVTSKPTRRKPRSSAAKLHGFDYIPLPSHVPPAVIPIIFEKPVAANTGLVALPTSSLDSRKMRIQQLQSRRQQSQSQNAHSQADQYYNNYSLEHPATSEQQHHINGWTGHDSFPMPKSSSVDSSEVLTEGTKTGSEAAAWTRPPSFSAETGESLRPKPSLALGPNFGDAQYNGTRHRPGSPASLSTFDSMDTSSLPTKKSSDNRSHDMNGRPRDPLSVASLESVPNRMTIDTSSQSVRRRIALVIGVALNEDLTCSYQGSKLTQVSVDGLIQMQVKTDFRDHDVPFFAYLKDTARHIRVLKENLDFVSDVTLDAIKEGGRSYLVDIPRNEPYIPLFKYKCVADLTPVPLVRITSTLSATFLRSVLSCLTLNVYFSCPL